jgi:sugar phosphate isomerase/epimerase
MAGQFRLGVVSVVFGPTATVKQAASQAAALGFEHLDVSVDALDDLSQDDLPLPIGDRLSASKLRTGCTCRAPRRRVPWEEAVSILRSQPGLRVEPTPPSILNSVAAVRAMCEEVPGLRITLDTGHVATWGEDPVELLDLADHVQLRQARRGVPQVHVDAPGDVDFVQVLSRLDRLNYPGCLSIEYFDIPEKGLPLNDPILWSSDLARTVRSLFY